MNQFSIKEILEAVGMLAIIASLLFVGLQLRQDQLIARAELDAFMLERSAAISEIKTSSEFSDTWAKMIEHPEDITISEASQIDGFLQLVLEVMFADCLFVDRGIFEECEEYGRAHIPMYFGNSYAQKWWKKNVKSGSRMSWATEIILDVDPNLELQRLKEFHSEK